MERLAMAPPPARGAARWPDRRLCDLFGVQHPIVQAPMAGAQDAELAIAAGEAGALASLPCALVTPETVREQVRALRARIGAPFNLNFFCHAPPPADPRVEAAWRARLRPYYERWGVDAPAAAPAGPNRAPFDGTSLALVAELRPRVVSFHFGLPEPAHLAAVKAHGCAVIASATTVKEALWLEARGVDAVVAQGAEAGGHRAMFLTTDVATQVGTLALVPQIADAVRVPVIAAGGIADARGIAAAFALGAAGVQIGTAYLPCAEARVSPLYRAALAAASDDATAITNVLTGRPARGIVNLAMRELGPMSADVPGFPHAAPAFAPLRAAAEAAGATDFSTLWAGQAVGLKHQLGAAALTRALAEGALERLGALGAAHR